MAEGSRVGEHGRERTLTLGRGALTFTWYIGSSLIQMYEWDECAEQPQRHLGTLTTVGEDGQVVEFDQEAFEAHVDWFLDQAAQAEIVEPGEAAVQRQAHPDWPTEAVAAQHLQIRTALEMAVGQLRGGALDEVTARRLGAGLQELLDGNAALKKEES
jgi:hypothetical protein